MLLKQLEKHELFNVLRLSSIEVVTASSVNLGVPLVKVVEGDTVLLCDRNAAVAVRN